MSKLSRRDVLKLSTAMLGGALLSKVLPVGGFPQPDKERPNVLLILFDTTSAPHWSLYGYPRPTTPNMERFANRATVYHSHYSAGNYTTPGTASILTGLLPWNHRAINPNAPVRRSLVPNNLFALIGKEYFRVGFSQNLVSEVFLRQFNEDLDFHLPCSSFAFPNPLFLESKDDILPVYAYEDFLVGGVIKTNPSASTVLGMLDVALQRGRVTNRELSKANPREVPFTGSFYFENRRVFNGIYETIRDVVGRGKPYFGYFHLYSPHGPYAPTKEFNELFNDGLKVPRKPLHPLIPKKNAIIDSYLDQYSRVYDQFITNVDAEFGHLIERLENSGMLENTYVIVLSDHGQLFERGVHGHNSRLLYDQGIRIPLLISAPGQTKREDVYVPTSNVDLLPTLVSLTGGDPPVWSDGKILPRLGGNVDESRSIFCVEAREGSAFRPLNIGSFVLIRGNRKLILYTGFPGYDEMVELYDLNEDPLELNDLSTADPATTRNMKDELDEARFAADLPFRKSSAE